MKKNDVYGHIGLPRFTSAEEFLRMMDRHEVEHTLLSTAQFCPDVLELSRAIVRWPDRFRAVGLPLGPDRESVRASVRAQLDAGFCGIRIHAHAAQEDPELLDILGRAGAFALVVAFDGWAPYCELLAGFLDRYPGSFVIGGHFAGPGDPDRLQDPRMRRLFGHARFHVAFTRQGHFDPAVLLPWSRALVATLGWQRVLWGSEWPVAIWRDERYEDTFAFIEQLEPGAQDRQAFFHDNAQRLIFGRSAAAPRPLDPRWDLMPHKVPSAIPLFPHAPWVPETLHQAMQQAYLSSGQDRQLRYGEFVVQLMERGLASRTAEQGGRR